MTESALIEKFDMVEGEELTKTFTLSLVNGQFFYIWFDVTVDLKMVALDMIMTELTGSPLSVSTGVGALKKVNQAMLDEGILTSANAGFLEWLNGVGKLFVKKPAVFLDIAKDLGVEITVSDVEDFATWVYPPLKGVLISMELGYESYLAPYSEIITGKVSEQT
jgi:hypothetical protein